MDHHQRLQSTSDVDSSSNLSTSDSSTAGVPQIPQIGRQTGEAGRQMDEVNRQLAGLPKKDKKQLESMARKIIYKDDDEQQTAKRMKAMYV